MNKDDIIAQNLQAIIKEYNEQMEGEIRTDTNGNRWRFHNGRWEAMCHIEPITFEQRLKNNAMPTKNINED